jgi:hypothetical protein
VLVETQVRPKIWSLSLQDSEHGWARCHIDAGPQAHRHGPAERLAGVSCMQHGGMLAGAGLDLCAGGSPGKLTPMCACVCCVCVLQAGGRAMTISVHDRRQPGTREAKVFRAGVGSST